MRSNLTASPTTLSNTRLSKEIWKKKQVYLLLLPAIIYIIIFYYVPIFRGFSISLSNYNIFGEYDFVGFKHYKAILVDMNFWRAFRNTLILAGGNLFIGLSAQILIAILLNELTNKGFKRITQTIIYTPNLFSWVAVGGIWISLMAPDTGLINEVIRMFGGEPIHFFVNEDIAQPLFIFLNIWKTVGYGCIIMLAALTNIDPNLFEAAYIDGAGRLKQIIYITLPSLMSTIKVVFVLNLISNLRQFSQSHILENPMIIDKVDVAMTYTYRMGIQKLKFDYASAVAFFMLLLIAIFTIIQQLIVNRNKEA
ncbi:ABC transporter permease subunit [Vallitalea okinawensis]|uniref:ABC transporter permease subunit n=1 Tax=Vallitalea okinawensis TaxID=2078660 RepID=UPI000CFB3A27|nr:ABC transporter permease subunit [Vallitalea okinawensis]